MNLNTLLGIKSYQTQGFREDGKRIPLTAVLASGNVVTQIKTDEKEGYNAIQLGIGAWRKPNKAELGKGKKAGLQKSPRFFKEVRLTDAVDLEAGAEINVAEVFEPGDIIDVVGVSKGKGFAGGVKRYGFKGGPRTHGQSDRERAPGSIGQTTTPGRVYKGKRMAGRMGHEQVTVKNLEIVEVKEDGTILVKGLVPGPVNNLLILKKAGKNKNFVPLYKEPTEGEAEKQEIPVQEASEAQVQPEEVKTTDEAVVEPAEAIETIEEQAQAEDTTAAATDEVVQTPEEAVSNEDKKDQPEEEISASDESDSSAADKGENK